MDSRQDSATERVVIPLSEEQAHLDVRPVERERVRVRKRIETIETVVERELCDEELEVARVPIDREVARAPSIREEGDLLIVPVVAEELVVRTRLVLKEELHIRRRRSRRTASEPVRLRREVAEVERADPNHETEGDRNDAYQ